MPRLYTYTGTNLIKNKESAMASELIKHVSDASFEADVLKTGTPVLVDYWAEWCGPCKMIAPILDEVAGTYQGKLQIAKMNVDENREIPAKFGIRGIPTLMLFKDGQLAATKVGAMSKAQLTAFIDQQLACPPLQSPSATPPLGLFSLSDRPAGKQPADSRARQGVAPLKPPHFFLS